MKIFIRCLFEILRSNASKDLLKLLVAVKLTDKAKPVMEQFVIFNFTGSIEMSRHIRVEPNRSL